jgi:hypothetical protein
MSSRVGIWLYLVLRVLRYALMLYALALCTCFMLYALALCASVHTCVDLWFRSDPWIPSEGLTFLLCVLAEAQSQTWCSKRMMLFGKLPRSITDIPIVILMHFKVLACRRKYQTWERARKTNYRKRRLLAVILVVKAAANETEQRLHDISVYFGHSAFGHDRHQSSEITFTVFPLSPARFFLSRSFPAPMVWVIKTIRW